MIWLTIAVLLQAICLIVMNYRMGNMERFLNRNAGAFRAFKFVMDKEVEKRKNDRNGGFGNPAV